MRPVIERIAQRVRHGGGPGLKLCERLGVAGAELFRHAVGAHRAPLVVIALEPDLEQVAELAVLGDVARREVIVVIQNRLGLGELMIQTGGRSWSGAKNLRG
jgi:hypothetical protein